MEKNALIKRTKELETLFDSLDNEQLSKFLDTASTEDCRIILHHERLWRRYMATMGFK